MVHFLRLVIPVLTGLIMASEFVPFLSPSRAEAAATQGIEKGVKLMMLDRKGCIYCAAWKREIGAGYASSAQGKTAPLAIIDIDGPWPDGLAIGRRPYLTPTFILLRDGQEIDRLEGYPGQDYFYPVLTEMMQRAGVAAK